MPIPFLSNRILKVVYMLRAQNTIQVLRRLFCAISVSAAWRLYMLVTLFSCFLLSSGYAYLMDREDILCLHSYHREQWTDNIQAGYESILAKRPAIDFHIEYMDTKKIHGEAYLDLLKSLYKERYANSEFDLILVSDNNALAFVVANGEELFGDAPVVFCGVNGYTDALLGGRTNITGVVEKGDFDATLAYAVDNVKGLKRLYAVVDDTATCALNLSELRETMRAQFPTLELFLLGGISRGELKRKLMELGEGDAVFFISFWEDSDGTYISPSHLGELLDQSPVPVFGRSEWMIEHGLVGGRCVRGELQGRAAASLAGLILDGTSPAVLPVVARSPNQFIFNYKSLRRYGLSLAALPEGSVVLEKPDRYVPVSRHMIFSTAIMAGILFVFVILLGIGIRFCLKSMRALSLSEIKGREILDAVGEAIFILDPVAGRVVDVNKAMLEMYQIDPCDKSDINFGALSEGVPPYSGEDFKIWLQCALKSGPQTFKWHARRKDGSLFWVEVGLSCSTSEVDYGRSIAVVRDITQRLNAEAPLAPPPAPNFGASMNLAVVISVKSVAFLRATNHPLRSALGSRRHTACIGRCWSLRLGSPGYGGIPVVANNAGRLV